MLVLSRKLLESIKIGDDITVTIVKVKGNTIRLGIEAPRSVRVVRSELPPSETTETTNGEASTTEESAVPASESSVLHESEERVVLPLVSPGERMIPARSRQSLKQRRPRFAMPAVPPAEQRNNPATAK